MQLWTGRDVLGAVGDLVGADTLDPLRRLPVDLHVHTLDGLGAEDKRRVTGVVTKITTGLCKKAMPKDAEALGQAVGARLSGKKDSGEVEAKPRKVLSNVVKDVVEVSSAPVLACCMHDQALTFAFCLHVPHRLPRSSRGGLLQG